MVELDHAFNTGKPAEYNWEAILDLDRIIPCVEGGKVIERSSPELAKAEIKVKMGAMSMTFRGTVEVVERDEDAHRAVLQIKSKDTGGQGYANADVAFTLERRRRRDPHRRADQRQGRVDGGGRRRQRPRRADQRLHDQARQDLTWNGWSCGRSARARCRRTAPPRSRTTRTVRCSAATAPTTTSASSAETCSRTRWISSTMTKRVRVKCARCKTVNVAVFDAKGET